MTIKLKEKEFGIYSLYPLTQGATTYFFLGEISIPITPNQTFKYKHRKLFA